MIASAASVASAEGLGCLAAGLGCPPVRLEGCCSPLSVAFSEKERPRPPTSLPAKAKASKAMPPSVLALFTKTSSQCAKVPLLVGISIKNERKISFSKVFATWGGREDTQSSPSLRSAPRAGVAIM